MTITIQEEKFDARDISQLYYAAMVIKENEEEPTQVSLAWLDKEGTENVNVVGYGVFVHLGPEDVYPFMYETREEMENVSVQIAQQVRQRRNGQ